MKNYHSKTFVIIFILLFLFSIMSLSAQNIAVQYRCAETGLTANQIKPHINIVNRGTTGVDLADLTVRYYYTIEDSAAQEFHVDYSRIGSSLVNGQFVQFSFNEYYLEVSFSENAGTLEAGQETGEIQLRFNKVNWSNYNQADDYSFNPDITAFTDYENITLYNNDTLVWGKTESNLSINITDTNWTTVVETVDEIETGIVYLRIEGKADGDRVTVHTWVNDEQEDVELALDSSGFFDERVAVCSSDSPDNTGFTISTDVTVYKDDLSLPVEVESPVIRYKEGEDYWAPCTYSDADIEIIEENGVYSAKAILEWTTWYYRVEDWGTVIQDGNTFIADSKPEEWSGLQGLEVRVLEHTYELGALAPGDYTFVVSHYGIERERVEFTVGGTIETRTLSLLNSGEGSGTAVVQLSPASLEGISEIETPAVVTYNDGEIVTLDLISVIEANNGSYFDEVIGYDGPLTMDEDKTVYYIFKNLFTEGLVLQYKCMERADTTNAIRANFDIINNGTSSVSLADLTLRYYYTLENPASQEFHCDHTEIGSSDVSGEFVQVSGDEYYLEIGFPDSQEILGPGSNTGEIQTRWNKVNWSAMTQSNDYSFNSDITEYTDWDKVEIFLNNEKVWPQDGTSVNYPPVVNILSPVDGTIFDTGDCITIEVLADDSEGEVVIVKFFVNGVKYGEDSTAPYSITICDLPDGDYSITASADDDEGASAVSSSISLTIGSEPIVREIDPAVKVNTIGFLPGKEKKASISEACTEFYVRDAQTGEIVYSGTISGNINSSDTYETVYIADFTSLTEPGVYYLDVQGVGQSPDFTISESVYDFSFYTVMRGMYLWRSGTAVSGTHEGVTFSHGPSHMNDGYYDYIDGTSTFVDGTGGWYDAGDYGKYVVNAGITVGMMFKAWEHFQAKLENFNLDIPESGGDYPDYLAELKWETDWLLKMQYIDGSGRVCHKLTPTNFSGFIMPDDDDSTRYFVPWGSAATADFTAMLAMAARIFEPYDPEYADLCLEAAELSYQFLKDNPQNHAADQSGFSTGGYTTTDPDDRLWAAAELWETTGDTEYLNDFESSVSSFYPVIQTDFDWSDVANLGMITYLESERSGKDSSVENNIRTALLDAADTMVSERNSNAYARPFGGEYYWGCNGTVARQTIVLQAAYAISQDDEYVNTALDAVGHLFGRNYYQRSYVTGLGYNPPMNPHDRRSGADGITEPWPGYLVGGGHSATGWVDIQDSYETNEVAINWNGALIYALAGFIQ